MEVHFGRKGPSYTKKNVTSNSIGYGAVLRPNESGELVEASVTDSPNRLGLFIALEAGTGLRNVLRWGSDSITNDSWNWTPGQAIYLSTVPGVLTQTGISGSEVGYAESSTEIVFGPVPSSCYVDATITITHTGSTFEAIIDVEPGAAIEWRFSDDTTDNTSRPVKDFGTASTRQTELIVTPWNSLNGLVVGYDAGDEGDLGSEYLLVNQNVTSVEGIAYASNIQFFAASNNPVTSLDFSGCSMLEKIECLSCTSLQNVNLSGTTSLTRMCIEASSVNSLDLTDCAALEDLRAGANGIDGISWGDIGSNIRHLCIWGNTDISLPDVSRFTSLEEFLIWESNVSGNLTFAGGVLANMDMHGNQIASVDVSCGFLGGASGVLNVSDNNLSSLNVSNSPEILDLDASSNNLDETSVDSVLETMNLYGTSGGTIDLSENAVPSATGLTYADAMISRSWTVTLDTGSNIVFQDLFDRADTEELDNNWAGHNADGQINNNALLSDAGGYGIIYNPCGGALPANHYVECTIPHTRVSQNWWGIATHINTSDWSGCAFFFTDNPSSPIACDTAEAGGAPAPTITITGGFPSSWAVDQDHTVGLEVIGSAWRILLDRQEYGTFTRTQTGTAAGVIGEGGRNWLDIAVYNSVPE